MQVEWISIKFEIPYIAMYVVRKLYSARELVQSSVLYKVNSEGVLISIQVINFK